MHSPYTLSVPFPRTLIAAVLRPLLERLVLWYLRDIAAQQTKLNTEIVCRLATLEQDHATLKATLDSRLASLEQDHATLKATLDSRLASLEQDHATLKATLDQSTATLNSRMAAYSQRDTQSFQILASQVTSLADLVGSCLVMLSRNNSQSNISSTVNTTQS